MVEDQDGARGLRDPGRPGGMEDQHNAVGMEDQGDAVGPDDQSRVERSGARKT